MSIFSRFPYTDFHRLNADWILEKIKEMLGLTQQAAETVEGYDDRLTAAETAVAGAVRFDRVQDLTALQQGQARDNIQAAPADMFGAVRYDQVQLLEAPQKARARSNIGAAEAGVIPSGVVRYDDEQSLTDAQTEQARENINVLASVISDVIVTGNTPTIDIAEELEGSAYETLIQCTGTAITTITISTALLSNLLVTIVFTTGATAPTFDSPLAIRGLDDLIPAANTTYEISIRGNRAAWKSWEVEA